MPVIDPSHRPVWRRHSVVAIRLAAEYAQLVGMRDLLPSGTRQRCLTDHAARSVRIAILAQLADDNR